jgi:hypothetical protein
VSGLLDELTAWATGRGGTSPGPEGLAVLDRVAQARRWPSSAPFYLTARQAVWRGDVAGAVRVLQAAGDPASAGKNHLPGADKAAAALLSGLQAREADAERLADVRQDAAAAAASPAVELGRVAGAAARSPGKVAGLLLLGLLAAGYVARR